MGASVKGRLAVELQLLINMEQTEDDENYFMDPYDNYSSKTIATVRILPSDR